MRKKFEVKMLKAFSYLVAASIVLAGCATVSYYPDSALAPDVGFYHEVSKGQTLWGISKTYSVELGTIIETNRLPNASKIEVGQLIFIPKKRASVRKAPPPKNTKLENFRWPLKGKVRSHFGSLKGMVKNKGIDIDTREGTSVRSSRSGKVIFTSNYLKGYGKTIIIDHLDGFETVYSQNSENLVSLGQHVSQGEIIAKAGKTGRTEKPALHFEIRKNHKPQNPFYYLP